MNIADHKIHEIDPELAILGSILAHNEAIKLVIVDVVSEDFISEANRIIFNSMLRLTEVKEHIDTNSLYSNLQKNGETNKFNGLPYLTMLSEFNVSSDYICFYCKILKEKSNNRKLLRMMPASWETVFSDCADMSS